MRLSATRMQNYLQCPRRYRFTYVDKVPVLPTPALLFGRALHAVIHRVHLRSIEQSEPIDLAFAVDELDDQWSAALREEHQPFGDGPRSPERLLDLGIEMLVGYVLCNQERAPPMAMELPFTVPCGLHELSGYVDRVDEGRDGLLVTDYKTGQRKPSPTILRGDLQLTVYTYALAQLYRRPVAGAVYYHLRDQSELRTKRTETDFAVLTHDLVPHVATGIQTGQFPTHFGWWCKACDFASLCKAERAVTLDPPLAPPE